MAKIKDIHFSKAPPGYSLTGTKGQWAWERPPEHSAPSAAVDSILNNWEKPEIQENLAQLLFAGVSIEELVMTTVKLGFTEGKFSADVAEIIKTPLTFYLMGLATDAGIHDARVFNTIDGMHRENYGMKDSQILNIMRKRNPDKYNFVLNKAPKMVKEEQMRRAAVKEERANSFLGEPPMVEGEE